MELKSTLSSRGERMEEGQESHKEEKKKRIDLLAVTGIH